MQSQFKKENVDTKTRGENLVFSKSGSVYKEKVPVPKAQDVLEYKPKNNVTIDIGDSFNDSGNHFESRAASVSTYGEARDAIRYILQDPSVARCTHNILAYRFIDKDNRIHEGIDDDGEH